MANLKLFLFILSILLFGIINIAWADYTDYMLSYWIADHFYNINLSDYWSDRHNIAPGSEVGGTLWLLCSLYICKSVFTMPIFLLLMFSSGYVATKLISNLITRTKPERRLLLLFILLWLVRIPLPYEYSTVPSTEAALFAW